MATRASVVGDAVVGERLGGVDRHRPCGAGAATLLEMLDAALLGQPRPVEDRAGSARFDTGVLLEVDA
jgi:hypothetical protein